MTRATLASLQSTVNGAADAKAKAARLWAARRSTNPRREAFDDVRKRLREMCNGIERCMYCEDSAGTDIEHFWPKASYPSSCFVWLNYLWACSDCNSNDKRSRFPLDSAGRPLLIDPTQDDPYEHFQFVPVTGHLSAVTERAQQTAEIFRLNEKGRLTQGRKNTWTKVIALVRGYMAARDEDERERHIATLRGEPFQAVVHHFFRDALAGRDHVPRDVMAAVAQAQGAWAWAL